MKLNIFTQCFALKPNESVLIVTDPTRSLLVGTFVAAAKEITDKIEVVSIANMTENAQEPPIIVAKKMLNADVACLITTYSLSHTLARINACKNGCRLASMPGITADIINRTFSADYIKIARLSEKFAKILTQGNSASLTMPAGTKLQFNLTGRQGLADTGRFIKPGQWGNLPAGEACIGPLENKTQGQLVIDGAISDIELDQPIKIIIKNGYAVSITGGQAAKTLLSQLTSAGPKAFQVAELGIGTNPLARLSSNALEAEKVIGTCHVAFGNNLTYGGKINVPFHSDAITLKPTLTIDGKIIL